MPHRKRKPKNSPTKSNSDEEEDLGFNQVIQESPVPAVVSELKRTVPVVGNNSPVLPAVMPHLRPAFATKSPSSIQRARKIMAVKGPTRLAMPSPVASSSLPAAVNRPSKPANAVSPPIAKPKKEAPPVHRRIFIPDDKEKVLVKDLSRGKEHNPVRLVSNSEDVPLPKFKYITARENAPDLRELIEEELNQGRYDPCCTSETCGQLCEEKVCPCRTYSGVKVTYRRYLLLYQNMDTYDNVTMPIKECNYSCYCHKAKNKAKKGQISCYNRTFSKGTKVVVDVFMTPDRGWGVRSRDGIKEGEYVGEYIGLLKRDLMTDATGGDYVHGLGERLQGHKVAVDAELQGNYTRFINHSCEPNVFVAKVAYETTIPGLLHLCLFALRDIHPNEEVLLDYGYDFWEAKAPLGISCQCGSVNCHHPTVSDSESESSDSGSDNQSEVSSQPSGSVMMDGHPSPAQQVSECEV